MAGISQKKSKISHKKFSRGVALTSDHLNEPVQAIETLLSNAEVSNEQLERKFATFRVDLWTPFIDSAFIGPLSEWTGEKPFSIPFMLPPLQDEINVVDNYFAMKESTPQPILSEIHFSFDQRAEGAAITDQYHNPGVHDWPSNVAQVDRAGYLDFTHAADVLNLGLSIVEKTPEIFQEGSIYNTEPEKEVYSAEIPSDAFVGSSYRANPLVITGINRTLNPYKTYVMLLFCKGLFKTGDYTLTEQLSHALVSVNVCLKFRMPLLARDVDDFPDSEVQNMPTAHRGTKTLKTFSVDNPAVETPIEAVSGDGIHSAMTLLDLALEDGLRGGYSSEGHAHDTQIERDAAYDVISVPLYANQSFGGLAHGEVDNWPYWVVTTKEHVWDRAIIQLPYPFVLHHVIFAFNWQCWSGGYSSPGTPAAAVAYMPQTTSDLIVELGVNLGVGLKAEDHAYQKIAGLSLQDPLEGGSTTWLDSLVDRVRVHSSALSIKNGGILKRQWDLFQVPLEPGVINGAGLLAQGPPIWAGRSDQYTAYENRSAAIGRTGLNLAANPTLVGTEQFLEVRCKIYFDGVEGVGNATDILVGYGGHRVYLIGKKHLSDLIRS